MKCGLDELLWVYASQARLQGALAPHMGELCKRLDIRPTQTATAVSVELVLRLLVEKELGVKLGLY